MSKTTTRKLSDMVKSGFLLIDTDTDGNVYPYLFIDQTTFVFRNQVFYQSWVNETEGIEIVQYISKTEAWAINLSMSFPIRTICGYTIRTTYVEKSITGAGRDYVMLATSIVDRS